MRLSLILTVFLAFISGSCSSPYYLPASQEIQYNEYGSYIKIKLKTASIIRGELISLENDKLVVLTSSKRKCVSVPIAEMETFKLRYAKPKHYGWTIPFFTLSTLSHGGFAIITAPLNLIVTIAVTATGESAFTHNNESISVRNLKMFARFPQGIPPNVDVASIQ